MTEKQDRRVRRTKTLMKEALIELMNEKTFGEITAKEITDKADLNRATFYLHYNKVFDLLDELENEVMEDFYHTLAAVEIDKNGAWEYPLILHICNYIMENMELCRCLLLNPRSDRLADKIAEIMKRKSLETRKKQHFQQDEKRLEYANQFIACGSMGMVKQWLSEETPVSAEEMAKLVEAMVHPIFQSFMLEMK